MFELSADNKYIFCEEIYISEEDEVDILTSDMYEIEQGELLQNKLNFFKNSIKYMDFDNFKNECQKSNQEITMKQIDTIVEDGIIRVIGSTKEYIYYKKSKHQKYLENSKEFIDRILIGKEEIYSVNKNDLSIKHITNLEFGHSFSFEDDMCYKINETSEIIRIISILTGKIKYEYKKEKKQEEFVDFLKNRYLIISVKPYTPSEKYMKLIDIYTNKIELSAKYISIVSDTIFYEILK